MAALKIVALLLAAAYELLQKKHNRNKISCMPPTEVHRYCAFFAILWMSAVVSYAQPVQSPYSAQEVGEFIENTLPHHAGMGHVGVALPQPYHIQGLQPALLAQASLTRLYLGVASDMRQLRGSEGLSLRYNSTNFGYVMFSFPIKAGRWGLRVGLSPYTQLNYRMYLSDLPVAASDSRSDHRLEGRGGINKAHLAQGFSLGKGLHIGAELDYYFGSVRRSDFITIKGEDATGFGIQNEDRHSYRGLGYGLALHYSRKIGDARTLSVGATLMSAGFSSS